MDGGKESKFIKHISTIYVWKGAHGDEVNKALSKLFERSGEDLEAGVYGQLSFIPSKKSKARIKIKPET